MAGAGPGAPSGARAPSAGKDTEALAATLAGAEFATAKRLAVSSWFPLDLPNARLHAAILESVAVARPELGLTPEIRGCSCA